MSAVIDRGPLGSWFYKLYPTICSAFPLCKLHPLPCLQFWRYLFCYLNCWYFSCQWQLVFPSLYRNLPFAIAVAMPLVAVSYLLVNIAYFMVLSPSDMLASQAVAEVGIILPCHGRGLHGSVRGPCKRRQNYSTKLNSAKSPIFCVLTNTEISSKHLVM